MVPRLILPSLQVLGRGVGPCKRLRCVPGHALQHVSGQGIILGASQLPWLQVPSHGACIKSPDSRCNSPDCLDCS